MTTPKSPFDLLAEHCGPNGKGFDPDNPFFKALWELCPRLRLPNTPVHLHSWDDDGSCIYDRTEHKGVAAKECSYKGCCSGTGYVRRSHEAAALMLWTAAWPIMVANEWVLRPGLTAENAINWSIWRLDPVPDDDVVWAFVAAADTIEDALSAALLAKEGVKADA